MSDPELIDRIIAQGRVLVEAIEALDSLEVDHPFERAVAELFQAAYRRRLMEIIEAAPPGVVDQIPSASRYIRERPRALWTRQSSDVQPGPSTLVTP